MTGWIAFGVLYVLGAALVIMQGFGEQRAWSLVLALFWPVVALVALYVSITEAFD